MISENVFTDKEENELKSLSLNVEMGSMSVWVVRDDAAIDDLQTVYISGENEERLQAACSCPRGRKDEPCPHALAVFNEIRSLTDIRNQLLKRPPSDPEAA
jgi:SWIM zinc finger